MRLPKSFNDITVQQYQDTYFLIQEKPADDFQYAENWARVISILGNVEYDEVISLPRSELKNLIKRLDFILRPDVLQERPKQYIAVGGTMFRAILNADKISVAQAFDIRGFQVPIQDLNVHETTVVNMHKLLASIFLPASLKGFKYVPSKHREISELMLHAKMGDVYGTLFFYPTLCERLMNCSKDFMNKNLSVLDNHLQEIQKWSSEMSLENDGAGKTQCTN